MASSNQTTKLKLSQFAATDKPQWLTDYNSDMEKIDEGTLDTATYDPGKVGGDAFLASNHKMTGYSKFSEYTPVLPSDSTLNAIAKLDAGFGTRGDMSKSVYDPTNVNGDAFWAANHKLTGYEKPEIAGEITADDDVRTALGKLDAGKINGITPGKNITVDNTDPTNPVVNVSDDINAEPPGTIKIYAGQTPPDGYLLCDGQAVSRTEYAKLFAVTGVIYGSGDGSTTFNLPDLRNRFVLGYQANFGGSGGAATHKLVLNESPSHYHTISFAEAGAMTGNGGFVIGTEAGKTSSYADRVGGDQPHNNMPPYLALGYIIKS